MAEVLDDEQLQKLQNVLYIQFHGLKLEEEHTQLITSESGWQKILKLYAASKRLENCADSTIKQYTDCVVKLITALNKRLCDISTNDIRFYLAMFQESRKCSISYMDTIRRYLSSFFAWCSDEGFIPRNPMRRIRHHEKFHRKLRSLFRLQRGSISDAQQPESAI